MMSLDRDGWALVAPQLSADLLATARETLFDPAKAGSRCLLDLPLVAQIAALLRDFLVTAGVLPAGCVAIQAIAFDKTAGTNWKVPWHQDLMFPFARPVTADGFELGTVKDGVSYARPPVEVLERLLAARLHLDPCGTNNAPLRVAPGSHRRGLVPSAEAGIAAREMGEKACLAAEGEVVLMRPLILHASSQATAPAHRRVLHFVYDTGASLAEEWHRRI